MKGQYKALVVDDEAEACGLLQAFLGKEGYAAATANSGKEALEKMAGGDFDAVVLDIRMQGIDGVETLKLIREGGHDCVVVMLTAVDDINVALECVRLGANEFLRKPVVLFELRHALESALEKRRLQRENRDYQLHLEDKVREQTAALRELNAEIKRTGKEIVKSLAKAIDARDPYTETHSENVTMLSLLIGREMRLSEDELESLEYGALLHDIGKIGIRGMVLRKPGRLTDEEYGIIRKHPLIGYGITVDIEYLQKAHQVIRGHHEKWDGTGYPDGLKGEQIGLLARIAAVADVFDAIASDRPYRKGMPLEECLGIIGKSGGAHFDPSVAGIFLEKKIYLEYMREAKKP